MRTCRTEADILEGIRKHDARVLEEVYQTHFPVIEALVKRNQGSTDEARDVFQEALVVIYLKVRDEHLELTCKFGTYLYAVCKKIWIQERKKYLLHQDKLKHRTQVVEDSGPEPDPFSDTLRKHLFEKHFAQLSPDCRKILEMFFLDCSVEEIQAEMAYKDIHHAADRKYRCKKSLIKRIMNDPLYKRLKHEQR